MERSAELQHMLSCGVIAIIRAPSPAGLAEAAEAIVAGGVSVTEFTLNTPEALGLIEGARCSLADRALGGAGTVLDTDDARDALLAGAQFIVMPILDRGAFETAQKQGVPVVPGAYTPTEVFTAWEWGADLVKLFPASGGGGPEYLRAIRAPLPQVPLVPTGGVSAANAGDYIRAGAAAVAVGGNLVDHTAIAAGEIHRLTASARDLVAVVQRARSDLSQ